MIDQIFLDLDGVLSDFHSEYGQHTKEEWQIEFPKFIERRAFVDLKMLPDAIELMDFLDTLGIPITILSSAGGFTDYYDDIVDQKIEWLYNHAIKYPVIIVPQKQVKAQFAGPTRLLIDDQGINCNNFWQAGGQSIQHVSARDTIDKIKEALA